MFLKIVFGAVSTMMMFAVGAIGGLQLGVLSGILTGISSVLILREPR